MATARNPRWAVTKTGVGSCTALWVYMTYGPRLRCNGNQASLAHTLHRLDTLTASTVNSPASMSPLYPHRTHTNGNVNYFGTLLANPRKQVEQNRTLDLRPPSPLHPISHFPEKPERFFSHFIAQFSTSKPFSRKCPSNISELNIPKLKLVLVTRRFLANVIF